MHNSKCTPANLLGRTTKICFKTVGSKSCIFGLTDKAEIKKGCWCVSNELRFWERYKYPQFLRRNGSQKAQPAPSGSKQSSKLRPDFRFVALHFSQPDRPVRLKSSDQYVCGRTRVFSRILALYFNLFALWVLSSVLQSPPDLSPTHLSHKHKKNILYLLTMNYQTESVLVLYTIIFITKPTKDKNEL